MSEYTMFYGVENTKGLTKVSYDREKKEIRIDGLIVTSIDYSEDSTGSRYLTMETSGLKCSFQVTPFFHLFSGLSELNKLIDLSDYEPELILSAIKGIRYAYKK